MSEETTNNHTPTKAYGFQFTGKGIEFFKIWLVNILLTIITLGIYSAWAKVRTNRYFYGNTILHQSSFEYLATPIQILKGRLIAIAFFILYSFLSSLNPIFGLSLLLIFFLATPYLVTRAIRFQHRMSAYKNIRFDFNGSVGEAFLVYAIWPLLSIFTFGLLYPFIHQRIVRFYVSNSAYGLASFKNTASVGAFYKQYIILFGIMLGLFIIGGLAISAMGVSLGQLSEDLKGMGGSVVFLFVGMYALAFVLYFIILAFIQSRMTNLIMNHTTLDEHVQFQSSLSLRSMLWILLSNLILIVFTFGLAYPWAKVRIAKYRAENTRILTAGTLDEFLAKDVAQSNAFGEEMSDIFDIDVGL